jgi:hypothetical protein
MIEPPRNIIPPTVTGKPHVGHLAVSFGEWSGWPMLTYQWRRGVTNIDGATAPIRGLAADDAGQMISCIITATNASGEASAISAPIGPLGYSRP